MSDTKELHQDTPSLDIRAKILGAKDIKEEEMIVDEWDVTVLVRGLTAAERANVLDQCLRKDGSADLTKLYPMMVLKTVRYPYGHKEEGKLIFQRTDRDALGAKNGGVVERLGLKAMYLSGMNKEARDEAAKNSEETPNEDSTLSWQQD